MEDYLEDLPRAHNCSRLAIREIQEEESGDALGSEKEAGRGILYTVSIN